MRKLSLCRPGFYRNIADRIILCNIVIIFSAGDLLIPRSIKQASFLELNPPQPM